MISRNDVLSLYRLILDRQPESEDVINEKRFADSISDAAADMLMSEEFIRNNSEHIATHLSQSRTRSN
jgi:hypothetical protein